MSLLDSLRAGIKVANKVTKPLQPTVTYKRSTTNTGYGITEGSSVQLKAIVDWKSGKRRSDGIEVNYTATLELLDIDAVVAATSGLGVKVTDVFILPDGSSNATVAIGGFVDAGTGHLIATTVYLG